MEHTRVEALFAQANAAARSALARMLLDTNRDAARARQEHAAAHYKRARVALGIES